MIKHIPSDLSIVFSEIPDEITLALNISHCQNNCPGCHSPYLRENIGEQVTPELLDKLIEKNPGITCICFMGEGNDPATLLTLARYLKPKIKVALYSGRKSCEPEYFEVFDYLKIGPYVESLGPLDKATTNQRLYYHGEDITYKFWRNIPGPANFKISDDAEHVKKIREALKKKKEKYGEEYCPCVLPKFHGLDKICPCEDYRTSGECHCKLYKS